MTDWPSDLRRAVFSWGETSVVGTATGSNLRMYLCMSACMALGTRLNSVGIVQILPLFDVELFRDAFLALLVNLAIFAASRHAKKTWLC